MKVQELFEDESDLLFWLKRLLDKGETVLLKAHTMQRLVEGRIMFIKDGHIVYDHQKEPRQPGTISNSFFIFKQPVDDNYKIHKIDSGPWMDYYELTDL